MGGQLSKLWGLWWAKKEIRILILGLVCIAWMLATSEGEETDQVVYHRTMRAKLHCCTG